jgi:hypothetical protein
MQGDDEKPYSRRFIVLKSSQSHLLLCLKTPWTLPTRFVVIAAIGQWMSP